MNKILFHEGGQPIHLDDLEFLQNTASKVFEVIQASAGNCILYGAVVNLSGFVSCTEGAILYNGKVYEILERQEIQHGDDEFTLDDLYLELSETQEEAVTFEDGQDRPTRLRCTATLLASKTPLSGKISLATLPALYDRASFNKPLASISLTSEYISLQDYSVLSKHSAVLTLKVLRDARFDEVVGTIALKANWGGLLDGIEPIEVSGEVLLPRKATRETGAVALELDNGKFYYRRGEGTSQEQEKVSFVGGRTITMLISWGYKSVWDYDLQDEL